MSGLVRAKSSEDSSLSGKIAKNKKAVNEATSALDRENEMIVQKELDRIMKDKSIVEIAHRLDTIRNSDSIFVFDKGKVVENGKFDDLMNLEGYFYKLEKGIDFM